MAFWDDVVKGAGDLANGTVKAVGNGFNATTKAVGDVAGALVKSLIRWLMEPRVNLMRSQKKWP